MCLELEEAGLPSEIVSRFDAAVQRLRPCPGMALKQQVCGKSLEQLERQAMACVNAGNATWLTKPLPQRT